MSLNTTPSANRIHIGIFGRRNAGKSSVINAITGQDLAIVSNIAGTTTDPVSKAMELLPLGPVVLTDTPGLDDIGTLGALRVEKTYQVLQKTDIAILVIDSSIGMAPEDETILSQIQAQKIPYILVMNKMDLLSEGSLELLPYTNQPNTICISTKTQTNITELKELIAKQIPEMQQEKRIVGDLLTPMDFVVLVIPIDASAPKGRLILPQQQTIRDILDSQAIAITVKDTELEETLASLGKKPKLIITDSQAFRQVASCIPRDIALTSFSILFARYKGDLRLMVNGAKALDALENGDTVLISEGCTHHRQCEDIGTVKIPKLLQAHTKKDLHFTFTSGNQFPTDLSPYKLIIHCGGCTLNQREMKYRLQCATDADIPITNYGIALAHLNGILERSIEVLQL